MKKISKLYFQIFLINVCFDVLANLCFANFVSIFHDIEEAYYVLFVLLDHIHISCFHLNKHISLIV